MVVMFFWASSGRCADLLVKLDDCEHAKWVGSFFCCCSVVLLLFFFCCNLRVWARVERGGEETDCGAKKICWLSVFADNKISAPVRRWGAAAATCWSWAEQSWSTCWLFTLFSFSSIYLVWLFFSVAEVAFLLMTQWSLIVFVIAFFFLSFFLTTAADWQIEVGKNGNLVFFAADWSGCC